MFGDLSRDEGELTTVRGVHKGRAGHRHMHILGVQPLKTKVN